ncbi:serine/threonine-protein kinase [Mycolicibacterium sp. 018/SC-01/001]|uniref:serine/threonine-protein kinase n=1 Tax=Mycolicibacterium sp. 018/SC-01/001 TaxID=2592069 RepID=UPI002105A5A7|nr:serine/threonine-protein kinase [Mycolicibacterium sp. 018/SC-01/001]
MEGIPFGRYRLIDLLGRGGMGEVWRAFDTDACRIVAIKVLPAGLADDPAFVQRFRREARTAASLNDPHIIPIHQFGEIDGKLYVDMRFVDGHDLLVEIQQGPIDPVRAAGVIEHTATALDTAHRAGLVHRDVKPSNILLDRSDFCYLIDFGIARSTTDTALTMTGATLGTWAYMAPERFSTGELDARCDVYALACVLFECLTGSQPYPGNTFERVAAGHLFDPVPEPSARAPKLAGFDSVIARGMAKRPGDRFQTASELATAARTAMGHGAITFRDVPVDQSPHADETMSAEMFARAPTHHRTPPPQPVASPPPVEALPSPGTRRARVVRSVAVLAVVVLTVAAFVVTRATFDNVSTEPSIPTPTTTTAAAPTTRSSVGPFTGNYRVNLAIPTDLSDVRRDGATAVPSEAWDIRSSCAQNGCIAVAVRRSSGIASEVMTFDKIGDEWIAVNRTTSACSGRLSDLFQVFVLRPGSDRDMSGNLLLLSSNGCSDKYAVSFHRVSDVVTDDMADPRRLPTRVPSPALGLWGRYHMTRAYAHGGETTGDYSVTTYCRRDGTQCVSYFFDTGSIISLVFADGRWTDNEEYEGSCSLGGQSHIVTTSQTPLPQPPQNPIERLVGSGHETTSGSACTGGDYRITLERTGD